MVNLKIFKFQDPRILEDIIGYLIDRTTNIDLKTIQNRYPGIQKRPEIDEIKEFLDFAFDSLTDQERSKIEPKYYTLNTQSTGSASKSV